MTLSFGFQVESAEQLPGELITIRDGTLLRYGKPEDFTFIDSLRKKEGGALGFIPRSVYDSCLERRRVGDRERWRYHNVIITEDNADLTGFALASYRGASVDIVQIVVRQDARRWHRALLMADHIEEKARRLSKQAIVCRVAIDLESNLFWQGIGFVLVRQMVSTWLNHHESKSKRALNLYRKPLTLERSG